MNAAVQKTTTINLPPMGTPMPGGILVGFMPPIDNHPAYFLILPTDPAANTEEELEWATDFEEVEGLSDWDGLANTKILAARGDAHPAAKRCAELVIGEHNDYYLISGREASVARAFAPHLMPQGICWTSSQYSALSAFVQAFSDGFQLYNLKDVEWRVCAVRRQLLTD